jgi:uncharacterized protein
MVLVDSWGWIALLNKRDPYHRMVLPAFAELLTSGRALFMTSALLCETLQVTHRYYGKVALLDIGQRMFETIAERKVTVLRSDEELEAQAWTLQVKFVDQKVSFTDCLSFAAMQRHGLKTAFTGDIHFTLLGFNIIPDIPR